MDDLEKLINEKALDKINNQNSQPMNYNQPMSFEDLNTSYLMEQVKQGKSISEIATDYAKAKTTTAIIENKNGEYDKLHKEFTEEQKDTLREGFRQDKIKSQTDTLTEKQKKAEAFYISFRPILEFDFSNLINRKETEKEEVTPKEYKDRSYGLFLMTIMLFLFIVPYCAVSILLAVFNGINAIFEAVSTFGKIAKGIVLSIFIISIAILIVYCALLGIDALFGTSIIKKIML